jgi:hypothetical protein
MRKILFIVAAVVILGIALAILFPALTVHQPIEKRAAVFNNLRQLDAAKQQWMLETKVAPDSWPSPSDLSPYIKKIDGVDGLVESLADEVYIINRADRPVAVYFPKDTQIRQWHFRGGMLFTMVDLQHYYDNSGKTY